MIYIMMRMENLTLLMVKKFLLPILFSFPSIIIGQENVGIDIEMMRPKILRIANKFTILEAYQTLGHEEAIVRKLTMVWCAKEALYKMYATPGLSFLQHIDIHDFFS